ncbi:RNA-directed DNA polymerase, eukaryota, Reverse transcriptase zinc-binding domain protein [Artemisia annua]|uniref:RNA-directed DNA polymerase, eukaryota, Reverse transcriptase zinc-binding domain protein n=1 Tax=Artemisia annua TaxID=35608 RepID=A0A2U1LKU9_ARTAN|nr:RNA-directed DNA polymerase, eukaryota, Reverse transcriptase zinc-binding domain protein [Artemisia annua]
MGFGNKCVWWIKACLESTRSSVLINGSLTMEFQLKHGLWKGDLCSFSIHFSYGTLHISMEDAIEAKKFSVINIGDICLSYLIYTDDVIVLGEWSQSNLVNILDIFNYFYLDLGLQISVLKSKLYSIGVIEAELNHFPDMAGCKGEKVSFM